MPGCVRTQLAEPHDADPALTCGRRIELVPFAAALQLLELGLAAMVAQHVEDDVLGHALGQVLVDHPADRHLLGQGRVGEEMVDAGTEREDGAQVGEARQGAVGHVPHQGELDLGRVPHLGPEAHLHLGHALLELALPPIDAVAVGLEEKGHGLVVLACCAR